MSGCGAPIASCEIVIRLRMFLREAMDIAPITQRRGQPCLCTALEFLGSQGLHFMSTFREAAALRSWCMKISTNSGPYLVYGRLREHLMSTSQTFASKAPDFIKDYDDAASVRAHLHSIVPGGVGSAAYAKRRRYLQREFACVIVELALEACTAEQRRCLNNLDIEIASSIDAIAMTFRPQPRTDLRLSLLISWRVSLEAIDQALDDVELESHFGDGIARNLALLDNPPDHIAARFAIYPDDTFIEALRPIAKWLDKTFNLYSWQESDRRQLEPTLGICCHAHDTAMFICSSIARVTQHGSTPRLDGLP